MSNSDQELADSFIYFVTENTEQERCKCGAILKKKKPFRDGNNRAICKDCYRNYLYGR